MLACNPRSNTIGFRLSEFDSLDPQARGLYAIWYKQSCIYVGKAQDQPLRNRLQQHWKGSHNATLNDWVAAKGSALRVSIKPMLDESVIEIFERFYIRKFKPLANRQHT